MENIEQRIKKIEDRNQKVEDDKKWETSMTRRGLLMLFTYLAIGTYMRAIDIERPWLNAVVPAVAFMLSTLTMPFFKRMWLGNKKTAKSIELFEKVKKLKLPIGKYALFGSAQLGIRGLKDCHDIDIIIFDDLWEQYKKKNWKKGLLYEEEYLFNEGIELWKSWGPGEWDIKQLIEEAEMIDGLPFVKLEKVLEWKKIAMREKDIKDIEIIENFLNKSIIKK
ncbi:MAG: hypothetical protein WCZ99_03160 [Candidatus Paceibacterota bacterium]|nr:hypothetical protein [Candidatus Paceibacterota bacterium]